MMRIHRFYILQSLTIGETLPLPDDIYHHCCHVLRLQSGADIQLFNGQGGEYNATLNVEKKKASATITDFEPIHRCSPCQIHLFQGLSKGDKMDWAIQKATELGVHAITPLITAHCTVKLSQQHLEKKQRHWQKIAETAACQSFRTTVPTIHAPCQFDDLLPQLKNTLTIVLHPWENNQNLSWPQAPSPNIINLLIGPEGGFSEQESHLAHDAGCHLRILGPRILRTETAAASAITLLQEHYGDF